MKKILCLLLLSALLVSCKEEHRTVIIEATFTDGTTGTFDYSGVYLSASDGPKIYLIPEGNGGCLVVNDHNVACGVRYYNVIRRVNK